jgi:hypothetical protein
MTEIESLIIYLLPTIRTKLMAAKWCNILRTKYISILLNTGDCEIVFNVEVEFPLRSDQPGGF